MDDKISKIIAPLDLLWFFQCCMSIGWIMANTMHIDTDISSSFEGNRPITKKKLLEIILNSYIRCKNH